jgi:hypothetical protein
MDNLCTVQHQEKRTTYRHIRKLDTIQHWDIRKTQWTICVQYNIKRNERLIGTLENWIQYNIETFERHTDSMAICVHYSIKKNERYTDTVLICVQCNIKTKERQTGILENWIQYNIEINNKHSDTIDNLDTIKRIEKQDIQTQWTIWIQ